jgi:hypothetical protein
MAIIDLAIRNYKFQNPKILTNSKWAHGNSQSPYKASKLIPNLKNLQEYDMDTCVTSRLGNKKKVSHNDMLIYWMITLNSRLNETLSLNQNSNG